MIDVRSANTKQTFCNEEKTMKLRDQAKNVQNTRPSRFRSDVPEETARMCQPWTKSVGERLRFASNVAVTITIWTST